MSITMERTVVGRNDPRYQQGMALLQNGAWQEAIRLFEELLRDQPESKRAQQALEEARFKASLSARTRIKSRRWRLPGRKLMMRVVLVVIVGAVIVQTALLVNRHLAPALAQAEVVRRQARLVTEGNALLTAGDLAAAEASFRALLEKVPDHPQATQGLVDVQEQRELAGLYDEAVVLQEGGQFETALTKFLELTQRAPRYRDAGPRLAAVQQRLAVAQAFVEAEALHRNDRWQEALARFQQIRQMDSAYRGEDVVGHMATIYVKLGRELTERRPPTPEAVAQALAYFNEALAIQPRNVDAALEQKLARLYLEGYTRYRQGQWDEAITRLQGIYDQRRNYLGEIVANMLFDAYMQSGDVYRDAGNKTVAYERFSKALGLPVGDKLVVRERIAVVAPPPTRTATPTRTSDPVMLVPTVVASATPTPTPTETKPPSPTSVPTATPTRLPPTAAPATAVPAPAEAAPTGKPFAAYHGQIVFYSTHPEKPGLWVMERDGQDRQYLGDSAALRQQHAQLVQQARWSPDDGSYLQERDGQIVRVLVNRAVLALTSLRGGGAAPAWSPPGTRIAFVSQEGGQANIWTVQPDGSGLRNLTANIGANGHPSWSPFGTRIVFWSNRTGLRQIHVMDADGRNAQNISNARYDEYDPVWVK